MIQTCPQCGREYIPVLERKTNQLLQVEFPDSEPWEREQLKGRHCSDKCYDESVGIEGYIYTDGKRYVLTPYGSRRKIFP